MMEIRVRFLLVLGIHEGGESGCHEIAPEDVSRHEGITGSVQAEKTALEGAVHHMAHHPARVDEGYEQES